MSEAALPGQTSRTGVGDAAVVRARQAEDVLVGGEIVRHRLSSRAIHWTVALFFFVCLFTGLPIWTPLFGWMATLFGGLSVCRWLHPWSGVVFSIASLVMFVHWFSEMKLTEKDREFLTPGGMVRTSGTKATTRGSANTTAARSCSSGRRRWAPSVCSRPAW